MNSVVGGGATPLQWVIGAEERAKHEAQFYSLKPNNGLITGEQARKFFLQSQLPPSVLAQIWQMSDLNCDGKMDRKEFSIAMYLIQKRLQGFTLPVTLPDSLKMDPPSVVAGSLQLGGAIPSNNSIGAGFNQQPMTSSPAIMQQALMSMQAGYPSTLPQPSNDRSPLSVDWSLDQASRLRHIQQFNMVDKQRVGYLSGTHARSLMGHSGLPTSQLAQIWQLSDLDQDGKLTCEEYCIAMHLIEMVKSGQRSLPSVTPPELVRSVNPHLIRGVAIPGSIVDQQPYSISPSVSNGDGGRDANVGGGTALKTKEDERIENFRKGQAELERRRQILQEQEKREREERQRKERIEQEKREQERLEAERRNQLELEKEAARQREIDMQRQEVIGIAFLFYYTIVLFLYSLANCRSSVGK